MNVRLLDHEVVLVRLGRGCALLRPVCSPRTSAVARLRRQRPAAVRVRWMGVRLPGYCTKIPSSGSVASGRPAARYHAARAVRAGVGRPRGRSALRLAEFVASRRPGVPVLEVAASTICAARRCDRFENVVDFAHFAWLHAGRPASPRSSRGPRRAGRPRGAGHQGRDRVRGAERRHRKNADLALSDENVTPRALPPLHALQCPRRASASWTRSTSCSGVLAASDRS